MSEPVFTLGPDGMPEGVADLGQVAEELARDLVRACLASPGAVGARGLQVDLLHRRLHMLNDHDLAITAMAVAGLLVTDYVAPIVRSLDVLGLRILRDLLEPVFQAAGARPDTTTQEN